MKAIDFEYYGYLDEDDGVIVPLEQEYEKKCRSAAVAARLLASGFCSRLRKRRFYFSFSKEFIFY